MLKLSLNPALMPILLLTLTLSLPLVSMQLACAFGHRVPSPRWRRTLMDTDRARCLACRLAVSAAQTPPLAVALAAAIP